VTAFAFSEKHLSQIAALQLFINLGYEHVSPEQALRLRGGRLGAELTVGLTPQTNAALDKNAPKWEYHEYPNAGRPALEQGSPSARTCVLVEGLSAVRGSRR